MEDVRASDLVKMLVKYKNESTLLDFTLLSFGRRGLKISLKPSCRWGLGTFSKFRRLLTLVLEENLSINKGIKKTQMNFWK